MDVNNSNGKPDFHPKWCWGFDYSKIDWEAFCKTIIARIIGQGNEKKCLELLRFYGNDTVLNALKNEITYLPDYAIEEVAKYFQIPKKDLLCFRWRQPKIGHRI